MNRETHCDLPIGVFDSGVGGLTVLKAIQEELPLENLVYLGDTARLPYGTKSPASIERYATQAAAKLREQGIKALVVACNTASAVALAALRAQMADVPVIGVIGPGATAAVAAKPGGKHLVLATEATVGLRAYRAAISERDPGAEIQEQACEMLVSLAEEGWSNGDIARAIVRRYLDEAAGGSPDTRARPRASSARCSRLAGSRAKATHPARCVCSPRTGQPVLPGSAASSWAGS
jgi:glutamate racemase